MATTSGHFSKCIFKQVSGLAEVVTHTESALCWTLYVKKKKKI